MKAERFNQRRISAALFTLLIFLDIAVRLLEKTAVIRSLDTHAPFTISLLRQPWWWLGLILGPLQLWTWMRILARTELSVAYSLSSIGYPLTMIAAWLIFNEHLNWQVWLGALFMTIGVAIVGSATSGSINHTTQSSAYRRD